MIPCTASRHSLSYRGRSDSRRSYRFRCTACGARAVIFRNSFWKGKCRRTLWLDRFHSGASDADVR